MQKIFRFNVLKKISQKLYSLTINFEKELTRDLVKQTLLPGVIVLKSFYLFPDQQNLPKLFFNLFYVLSLTFLFFAHGCYLLENVHDVIIAVAAVSTLSTSFQCIFKVYNLISNRRSYNKIFFYIWKKFWPNDLLSEESSKKVSKEVLRFYCTVLIFSASVLVCVAAFTTQPLVFGNMKIPFPFASFLSTSKLPYYELIFIWEVTLNCSVVCFVLGYDFMLYALIQNITTQFDILRDVLLHINLKMNCDYRDKLKKIGIDIIPHEDVRSRNLILVKCIKHHQMLIKVCTLVEATISQIIFAQFVTSLFAMCVGSVCINRVLTVEMVSYQAGYFIQLYVYCYYGSELIAKSDDATTAVFQCGWEKFYNKAFRSNLLCFLQNTHKYQRFTAMGFCEMSCKSLISVLRLSFSFYTLIMNLIGKSKDGNK